MTACNFFSAKSRMQQLKLHFIDTVFSSVQEDTSVLIICRFSTNTKGDPQVNTILIYRAESPLQNGCKRKL